MDDSVIVQCIDCQNDLIPDVDVIRTDSDGDLWCADCSYICESCEDVGSRVAHDWFDVGGELWCQHCTSNNAYFCDSCCEYNSDYVNHPEDSSYAYCENCTYDNLTWCDGCDSYYINGCDSCLYDDDGDRIIHDYSYRPDPIFHALDGKDRLFFGLEIETEAQRRESISEPAEYASRLEDYELAYLKHDGSLNNGFEIVTHPMTHDYFHSDKAQVFWDTLEKLRTDYRMRSWSTGTCGLHIHISRAGFSGGAHQHRFLNLIYSNRELYTRLAGRESDQWAKFDDVITWKRNDDGSTTAYKSFKYKLSRDHNSDRYSAVNTNNRNTLEMRIFRGTLNTATVKACLDLAHASVEYTRTLTVRDVNNGALQRMNFISYIHANSDKYAQLVSKMDRVFITSDSE